MFNSATVNRLRSHRRLSSESAAGSRYELLPISEEGAPRSSRPAHLSAASFYDSRLWHSEQSPRAAGATHSAVIPTGGDRPTDLGAVSGVLQAARLYRSLQPPRCVAAAAVAWLVAVCTTVPLVFRYVLVGDKVWQPLAGDGTYLHVDVVSAANLTVPVSATAHSGGAGLAGDGSLLPNASGDLHWTAVANATRATMWRESFTFSQGNARARKVVLWVKQCPRGAAAVGSRVYREADPNIGLAMVPLPTDKTPVSVTEWASGELFSGRMVAGWYPIQGPPRVNEADYAHADAPAVGSIYVRVSYAERQDRSGYCEQVDLSSPVAQPVDGYSSVAFLFTGTHMLAVCASDAMLLRGGGGARLQMLSGMSRFPVYSCVNGLTQYWVGVGSFLFHASMTDMGQNLDMSGVYAMPAAPALYLLLRLGAFGEPHRAYGHLFFTATVAMVVYVGLQYRAVFETAAGGSVNLVLCQIAALACFLAAWMWGGSAGQLNAGDAHNGAAWDDDGAVLLERGHAGQQPHRWVLPHRLAQRFLAAAAVMRGRPSVKQRGSDASLPSQARQSEQAAIGSPRPGQDAADGAGTTPPAASPGTPHSALLTTLRRRVTARGLHYRWLFLSCLSIGVAYACREVDVVYHAACSPSGWYQLHALWHVFSAASLYCLWVFFRSEAPTLTNIAGVSGGEPGAPRGAASPE